MSKALISVTMVTNKFIGLLWKTDIGTVEYSIATSFRSIGTDRYDTVLKVRYGTVPNIFLFTLIYKDYVSKDYGD